MVPSCWRLIFRLMSLCLVGWALGGASWWIEVITFAGLCFARVEDPRVFVDHRAERPFRFD